MIVRAFFLIVRGEQVEEIGCRILRTNWGAD